VAGRRGDPREGVAGVGRRSIRAPRLSWNTLTAATSTPAGFATVQVIGRLRGAAGSLSSALTRTARGLAYAGRSASVPPAEPKGLSVDNVIAGIAAGIALVALVVSIVVARRQTAIQERVAAIEEARRAEEVAARGRAWVTARLHRGFEKLILRNEGPALARGVNLEVEEGPQVPPIFGLEALPVDLQPGQTMSFQTPVAYEDATMLRVTVRWTDEAGDHEEPFTLQTR
jgi:hypothetical protein